MEVIEAITMRNRTRKYLNQSHIEFPSVGILRKNVKSLEHVEEDKMVIRMNEDSELKGDLDMIMEANLMAHNTSSHTLPLDDLKMMPTQRTFSYIQES